MVIALAAVGLAVVATAPTSAATGFSTRVIAAGAAYTDAAGRTWAADHGSVGGSPAAPSPTPIAGTVDDALYQKHRWAMSSYDLAVPCPATYRVDLHLAEFYFYAPGQRIFSVAAEGATNHT